MSGSNCHTRRAWPHFMEFRESIKNGGKRSNVLQETVISPGEPNSDICATSSRAVELGPVGTETW